MDPYEIRVAPPQGVRAPAIRWAYGVFRDSRRMPSLNARKLGDELAITSRRSPICEAHFDFSSPTRGYPSDASFEEPPGNTASARTSQVPQMESCLYASKIFCLALGKASKIARLSPRSHASTSSTAMRNSVTGGGSHDCSRPVNSCLNSRQSRRSRSTTTTTAASWPLRLRPYPARIPGSRSRRTLFAGSVRPRRSRGSLPIPRYA